METTKNKKAGITYENKNAHSECPRCEGLNTFFVDNAIYCKDCKKKKVVTKITYEMKLFLLGLSILAIFIYIAL